eukprot:239752-Chlamydomonas_euryale.AAC.10
MRAPTVLDGCRLSTPSRLPLGRDAAKLEAVPDKATMHRNALSSSLCRSVHVHPTLAWAAAGARLAQPRPLPPPNASLPLPPWLCPSHTFLSPVLARTAGSQHTARAKPMLWPLASPQAQGHAALLLQALPCLLLHPSLFPSLH